MVGAIVNHLVIGNDDIVLKMLTLLGMMLYIVPYCLHTNVKKSCENNKKSQLTGISQTVGLVKLGIRYRTTKTIVMSNQSDSLIRAFRSIDLVLSNQIM